MANPTVALRLDEQTVARLKKLGQRRDRSPHFLMKEAVEKYLASEESIEAERQLTQARWERFALTGEAISHEEVKAWADSLTSTGTQA
jgi:predicted transcriptional regulator